MRIKFIPVILIVLCLSGCKTQQGFLDAVWENPDYERAQFNKIVVFGLVENVKNRKNFEKNAVKYFKSKGVAAVAGYELFETINEIGDLGNDALKKQLYDQGFDGVLATKVLKTVEKEVPKDTVEFASSLSKNLYRHGVYFTPRYAQLQNNINYDYAVIESNFYYLQDNSSFEGGGMVWISHYKLENEAIHQIDVEITDYAYLIVQSLFDDQVILPK